MDQRKHSSLHFVLKTLLFGIILIVIVCYWTVSVEGRIVGELTDFSIFPTVIFMLFSVAAVNLLLKRFFKRFSFSQAELATTYIMMSIATALAGHDMIWKLVPMMGIFWYATPENEWQELFFRFIPRWLAVDDKRSLEAYWVEGASFWEAQHIKAWIVPILAWSAFVIVLLFVMLCINIIIRKQWIEHEKLSYPLTELPLEVTSNTSKLFSNRLMWMGFGIAFGIEILAGIHYLYPAMPSLTIKYELGRLFTEKPWSAIGWLPINIYAFGVGLGYLMRLELSFSLWIFYLFWKMQPVFLSAVGWETILRMGYNGGGSYEQRAGVWIGIGILALWMSRTHIKRILFGLFSKQSPRLETKAHNANTDKLSKMAIYGIIAGMIFILIFWSQAGLSYWVALPYFGIYLVFCVCITRMRAELGPPTHELHNMHPDRIMVSFMGTRKLGVRNLTITTLFAWLAYGYRTHPMPHQLEGFKIGSSLKIKEKRLVIAMVTAAVVGTFVAILFHVSLNFKYQLTRGPEYVERLQGWVIYPVTIDVTALQQMGFGFFLTMLLTILTRRFIWWSLYPVGYAVGDGWVSSLLWFSIFLGWLSKRIILSGGGLKGYRRAMPLFLGFVLGQFLAGSLWSIIGMALDKRVHTFFP